MSIIVVGSFVVDCIARCDRAPLAGETVFGNSFNTYLGGKGANQAFAAKRMRSDVIMVGAIGKDAFGQEFLNSMNYEGFDTSYIKIIENNSTGTSLVYVEETGQNRIVMTPGANIMYDENWLYDIEEEIKRASLVVSQFEMRYEVVKVLSELCKKHNTRFILNPAPARKITDDVLDDLYLITPNETELGLIVDKNIETIDEYIEAARVLISKGVKNVIVTLGTEGSLLVNKDGHKLVPSFKVKAIDTLGAGDSYTGSLSAMLDNGYSIEDAMIIATAVAALEVQEKGGIPAMPKYESVKAFLEEKNIYILK